MKENKIRSQSVDQGVLPLINRSDQDQSLDLGNQNNDKFVNTFVKICRQQQYCNYQHKEGTCCCGTCICGNCRCIREYEPTHYPKALGSTYRKEYSGKNTPILKPIKPVIYTSDNDSSLMFHKNDYAIDFSQAEIPKLQNKRLPFKIYTSFSGESQYSRFHQEKKNLIRDDMILPVNNINIYDLPTKFENSTYRDTFAPQANKSQIQDLNFAQILDRRLHVNLNEKNLYQQTTNQQFYMKHKSKRENSIIHPTQIKVVGLSQNDDQTFRSISKQDFSYKQKKICPARQYLVLLSNESIIKQEKQ